MFLIEQRRLISPLFRHRPVTGRLIDGVLAQKLSRICDWVGSDFHDVQHKGKRGLFWCLTLVLTLVNAVNVYL
jgi:hypothetical protein